MRRYILFVTLLAWLGGALSAQNINRTFQLDKITRDLVEQLDKSTLTSGILLQKAPMFVNPFRYDGTTLSDSNTMDASTFGRLYGQLRSAALGISPFMYILGKRPRSNVKLSSATCATMYIPVILHILC